MKADSLNRRLEDLERQGEPDEYILVWADDEHEPLEPGVERIQLKWADDP